MVQDNSYLVGLHRRLELRYRNNEVVNFKIVRINNAGFTVQIGGLYGFIPFDQMPWSYKTTRHWRKVSSWIINEVFKCKIESLSISSDGANRVSLLANGTCHEFKNKPLITGKDYQCVVLQKTDYGLFVDLGFHENFANGSFVGLIHKTNLDFLEDYEVLNEGDVFETTFFGYAKEGWLVLGDNYDRIQWQLPEITNLVGTIQEAVAYENEEGKINFLILNQYRAKVSMSINIYGNELQAAKDFHSCIDDGQIIICEVVKVSRSKNGFVIKLLPD